MNDSKMMNTQCCFCAKPVANTDIEPIVLNIDVGDGGSQQLYCHARCLKDALDPSVPLFPFDDSDDL